MTSQELADRMIDATFDAIEETYIQTASFDPAAKAAVVAVLRVLADVAPGTPEYAVEFDFAGLADEIEKR